MKVQQRLFTVLGVVLLFLALPMHLVAQLHDELITYESPEIEPQHKSHSAGLWLIKLDVSSPINSVLNKKERG